MKTLLHDVEVEGRHFDVRLRDGRVAEMGKDLPAALPDDVVINGKGGALIPGLHDHHVHLLSLARALESVDCAPASNPTADDLVARLRNTLPGPDGWLRGAGYHERTAGPLDRHVLDRWVPNYPLRVQHRTGALWMLNSAAIDRVGHALGVDPGVERDAAGALTGRLWRCDDRLRAAIPAGVLDLAAVGGLLAAVGITGVTDATPDLNADALDILASAAAAGALPQKLTLLGTDDDARLPPGCSHGPRKLLLHDHDLPGVVDLAELIRSAHAVGRPVAVHCVTSESLVITLAALERTGSMPGDRIEHASVVPVGVGEWMARLGVRVVTQPDFLRTRGDDYVRDVEPDEADQLYPYASLLAAGVPTCPSSDAPYGDHDPWRVLSSASTRMTHAGTTLGSWERVPAAAALAGYLSAPDRPGGPARRVRPGMPATVVLLHEPLAHALRSADPLVRAVWIEGTRVV